MKKRVISLLMALLMLTSLLPSAVWAEGDAPEQTAAAVMDDGAAEQEPAVAPENPEAPVEPEQPAEPEQSAELEADAEPEDNGIALYSAASGSCGKKVTYTLSDDGVLTISGTGAMTNFTYTDNDESNRPWHSERESIRKVVIEEGVTSIGNFAFSFCNVQEVTIPSTVTSIGKRAFMGTPLSSVVIPEGVTTIEERAFWRCAWLESITLPVSLAKVGQGAFYAAEDWDDEFYSELTDIYYGGSAIRFGSIVGIRASWIPDNVTIHYGSGGTDEILYKGKCGKNVTYTLSDDGVLTISGKGAMTNFIYTDDDESNRPWHNLCFYIQKVVIEDGVTSIGNYAFAFFPIQNITIPDSVTSIGTQAFWGCAELKNVTFSKNLTSIGDRAFIRCTGLTELTLPDSLKEIGEEAFWNCSGLTKAAIPNSVTTIGHRAFCMCTELTEAVIPDSVTSLGNEVFWGCESLTRAVIGNGLTTIGAVFGKCTGLTEVVMSDSMTSIGQEAFYGCTKLNKITFSKNLTSIGYIAFAGCTGLTEVVFPDGLTEIAQEAFENCTGLTKLVIPDSVTTIDRMAFRGCTALRSADYMGTAEQWNKINIGDENYCLYKALRCITLGVIVSGKDTPDIKDIASLYDHLTGQAGTAYTARQEKAADMNQDGQLDVYDLQLLYETVVQNGTM